jgi:protein-disulfide isomerase
MGKKDEIRKQREQQKRRTRIMVILGIVIFAVLIVSAVALPVIKANMAPLGTIQVPAQNPRPLANGLSMGDPAAPVIVEEYSDFQCPYCKQFSTDYEPAIVNDFITSGKVYFKYIPFHLIGAESDAAAQAAYCAGDQNKFWEYHDILFANQTGENIGDFSDRRLTAFAEKLGLNMADFNSCYKSGKYLKQLKLNNDAGTLAKVDGTPSFYVNGKKVDPGSVYQTIAGLLATK